MKTPDVVSPEDWEAAKKQLLVKEKKYMRDGDALAAERRRMPWMAVEKDYRFEGPNGSASLADLFAGRRQLVVYRAYYGPEVTTYAEGGSYPKRACVGCSFVDARVDERMGSTWSYLDITALGRQEEWEDSPDGYPQTPPYGWWNYHDSYEDQA